MRKIPTQPCTWAVFLARAACAGLIAGFSAAHSAPPVNDVPPTVTLTSPANGASFFAPATVNLAATAGDSDGTVTRVDFFRGNTLIGTSTAAPYTFTWTNVAAGSYTLTAKATDNGGATATSAPVSITVNSATALVIASPADGAAISILDDVTVSGTFESSSTTGNTILVDNGNKSLLAAINGNSYSVTFLGAFAVSVGSNTFTVNLSRSDKTSATRSITLFGYDNPRMAFTAPSSSTFNAPATVTFVVDVKAPGGTVTKVDFLNGNTLVGTFNSPPYQVTLSNLAKGTYTITANATSNQGGTRTATATIVVVGPNVPPSISITSPAAGAVFNAPATVPITVNATDSDGTVTLVEFFANGATIGATSVPPFSFTWSNVAAGSYSLTARATDDRSGQTTSAPVSITVNNPPTATLTSPSQGASFLVGSSITLTANASDTDGTIARVEFYQGSTLIGTAPTAPYSVNWSVTAAGTYTLTVKAFDNLGGAGTSAAVTITVTGLQASITSPANGATFTAPATIPIAADAAKIGGGTITKVEFFQGTTLIGTATAAPYTFSWTNVAVGTYTLTAKATDSVGASSTSAGVAVSVTPLLTITSPVNGATVGDDRVLVTGQAVGPQYTGVKVNGVVAFVDANGNFYANNVGLSAGSNTITATLTATDGTTTSRSITVSSTGPAPIRIDANPFEGGVPLSVAFTVTTTGGASFTRADYDFNGDGSVDFTLNPPGGTVTVSYPSPGVYTPVVTATDSLGRVVQRRFAVLADANPDAKLRATFNAMLDSLRAGDVNGALSFITGGASAQYATLFSGLKQAGTLTDAVNALGTLRGSTVGADFGEVILSRDTPSGTVAFPIWFLRGPDGIWRIEGM